MKKAFNFCFHNFRYSLLLFLSSVLLSSCGLEPKTQKIGVFVQTNKGLLELTSYGEQTGMNSYDLAESSNPPKVTKVNSFYVNMPDIEIANSKIFWVSSLERQFHENKSIPLTIDLEITKNNIYKINCSDLVSKKGGYAVLKIGMPMGTADRIYPVQIAE